MKRVLIRLLLALLLTAGVAVGVGVFHSPARPTLRAALDRAGLGQAGDALLAHADRLRPGGERPPAPQRDAVATLPPAVTVVRATEREFRDLVFVSGTLVAREEALVGPQINAVRIVEVLAEDGDRVGKGQVLARLDRSQFDAQLAQNDAAQIRAEAAIAQATSAIAQVQAAYDQAQADLARARRLEAGVIAPAVVEQRATAARSAEAQLAAARGALAVAQADKRAQQAQRRELDVQIARTEVRAPVAGVVSRRSARLGALAVALNSSDPLFRIIADGAIDLEAEVPDDALARIGLDMPAEVSAATGNERVTGRVRLVSSEVDKATRLGRIRIALPPGAPMRVGSFATANIEVARRTGVAVPTAAASGGEGAWAVQVVKGDRVETRPAELGLSGRNVVEVRKGLAPGETVVARAAAFLRSGDAIRPMPIEQEAQR